MAKANTVVLVGTFRPANEAWIKSRRLYNLPLPKCGKVAFHDRISRIVLVAEGFSVVAYAAKFKEVVDRDRLKAEGYRVATVGRGVPTAPHGDLYALYELGEKLSAAKVLSDASADVFVASSRCPNVRIDAAFYSKPYPRTGGKSMPYVFDKLKPYFKKWHSAATFDPIQGDFFDMLEGTEKNEAPFAAPSKGKFTFIDLFAGIGGIRLGYQAQGGKCVFSSEWDSAAAKTYYANFGERPFGDIQKIDPKSIPDFDILLAGFPCQSFSTRRRNAA